MLQNLTLSLDHAVRTETSCCRAAWPSLGVCRKVVAGSKSLPRALKRGHIFNGLGARLKSSPSKTCVNHTSPAAAAHLFARFKCALRHRSGERRRSCRR